MGNDEASAQQLQGQALPGRAVTAVVCVGLTLLVLLVFADVGNFDFVTLDDDVHVYENPHVQTGLNAQNVAWAFGVHGPGQWHPLAYLSHQFVYEYFGADARPHHLASLAFHVASVVVLLLALRKMTGRLWPSAFVAAMFGLHPLSVETVSWICERRDVMCGLFWMFTLWVYAGYAQRGGRLRYFLVALCCALALMSKPMAVTLPCILLLLDFWPLRRTQFRTSSVDDNVTGTLRACPPRSLRFLVLEKLPLLGLSAVSSVLSILSHRHAVVAVEVIPFHVRVANALVAYIVYLRKMIWPADLCVWYPHPALQPSFQLSSLIVAAVATAAFLLAITAFVVYQARRRPYLTVGWFWYLGVLFPVSGLFQTGMHAYADRFTYLSLIGIYIAIAWGGAELISRWPFGQLAVKVATPALLVACMWATSIQLATWRDSRTLYEHALSKTKENSLVHTNLGNVFLQHGDFDRATSCYENALRFSPRNVVTLTNLGTAFFRRGDLVQAAARFEHALRLNPDYADAHNSLGLLLEKQGQMAEAKASYENALRLNPEYAEAHNNLGRILAEQGIAAKAMAHLEKAIQLKPNLVGTHTNIGNIMLRQGRPAAARTHYEHELRITPEDPEAQNNLGAAFLKQGDLARAQVQFERALALDPELTMALSNLGVVLVQEGRLAEARELFQRALQIDPGDARAHWNMKQLREMER